MMTIDLDELAHVLRLGACSKIALCGVLTLIFNRLAVLEFRKRSQHVGPFEVYRSLALACFWTVAVQCAVLLDPFLFHRDPAHGLAAANWLEGVGWAASWSAAGVQVVRHWLGAGHVMSR